MATANYVLLDRIELNATAASITFANIPQTGYTDLKIVMSARSDYAAQYNFCALTFNGTSTGYSARYISGNGSSASSGTGYTDKFRIDTDGASNTANTFGSAEVYIPSYTASQYKSISVDWVYESNSSTNMEMQLMAGLWSNNAAITSITYTALNSSTLSVGSTFSLYGLAAVGTTPAIAPKADGGNVIATDGTYWYHAFLANGTFTPQTALSADVLVVAGGGSGALTYGNQRAAGGGAGGVLSFSTQSLVTSTGYACTVGGGGTGQTTYLNPGNQGTNSQFSSLTASVGGGAGSSGMTAGTTGGSGGGGGGGDVGIRTGLAGTSGQGYAGGNGGGLSSAAGGGGGAGSVGSSYSGNTGGAGGAGLNTWSSWLSATALGASGYIGGGGGGNGASGNGAGGSGGGSAATTDTSAINGIANTGGGSGGHYYASGGATTSGNGGSGIIIIRYAV